MPIEPFISYRLRYILVDRKTEHMDLMNLRLRPVQNQKIEKVLEVLLKVGKADYVSVVSHSGQNICHLGELEDVDLPSVSSLAAGFHAASSSLAGMLGEEAAPRLMNYGEKRSMIMAPVGTLGLILMVVSKKRRNQKKVATSLKQAGQVIEDIMAND